MKKKVLIFSEKWDPSTNEVINWLYSYNAEVIRLDYDTICEDDYILMFIDKNDFELKLKIGEKEVSINEIDSYWFRRGGLTLKRFTLADENNVPPSLIDKVLGNLKEEKIELINVIHYFLEARVKRRLGSFKLSSLQKLEILHKAGLCGLRTPKSYVINSKKDLIQILLNEKGIITKAIKENLDVSDESMGMCFYNFEINHSMLKSIPPTFFPSLIQEKIEKKFEIRTVLFNDKFYSIAIVSQNDKQTKVDYRQYNMEKPNKFLPYKLPLLVETKIKALFEMVGLDFGSIDLIKTIDNEYVFLEINPIGQFGMVSWPMNYNVEKEIAKYLAYEE